MALLILFREQNAAAFRDELAALDESVEFFSAPGEDRECVEIARRIHLALAELGGIEGLEPPR